MRLLLDCRMSTWTGVGRYTVGLAQALGARDDIELTQVMAPETRSPVPSYRGARSITARKHPFTAAGARELGHIAAAVKPDLVHCPHFPTPAPASHPLVVTLHDVTPLVVPGVMPSPIKRFVYRRLNRRAVGLADAIITDSAFSESEIVRMLPEARHKIVAVPLGVDDFASGRLGDLDSVLAEIAELPYLLSMGSTRAHKDLPTLLHAFARLARRRPGLNLLLVGADDRAFIEAHLPKAPRAIRDRIFFTGRVGDPQLRTLMRGAEAFIFPSRYEGFGLPPLEAMAMGTPVIVADAASLPEVAGQAALLFPPGDVASCEAAIDRVLGDEELRDELSRSGFERAERFTWERTAAATVAVYQEALKSWDPSA
ncbi:MAG: glycosyltransferase family 4 protein [Coriobacteriia bacterium]